MESEFSNQLKSQVFEILSSNDDKPMEALFSHFFSSQQSQQSQAQAFFQCGKRHFPDLLFIKLFFLVGCSPLVETRANAVRVLRFVKVSDLWPQLREAAHASLKSHFINYLKEENSMPVLRMVCVVVSETVSEVYKVGQQWPELLGFLLWSLRTNNDKFQETALLVFGSLSKDCRRVICEALGGSIEVLHSAFLSALASNNHDVKVASFGAVVNLVHLYSDSSNRGRFHDLLRAMMVGVFTLLNSSQDGYVQKAFEELTLLVSEEPQLLKPYMCDMVLDMLQIAESPVLNEEIQNQAMKMVINMTELMDYKPLFLSLTHQTVVRLFLVPMKMLLCIEEDMAWNELEGEGDGNTRKTNVFKFGIKCLNQLSITLGGSKVVPAASELLPLYFDTPEWRKRHAGIIMLAVIAKEVSDEMVMVLENFLGEVVTKLLKSFRDSHLKVRLAAFSFMQMPTNFVQVAQLLHHSRLMPAFISALDHDQNDKVKEQASSAMLFFLKNTLPESLTMYRHADAVIVKFLALLRDNGSAKQRSIALSCVNLFAQQCREVVFKHYVNYLPILLESCSDENSEVKEAATRGIRICAECGPLQFKPFIHRTLLGLSRLIQDPNRLLPENAKAYDIAVSSLGRICYFHHDSIDCSQLVPVWLSLLPLRNDFDEAKLMHEQLCLMVGRLDKELLGPGDQNLTKIVPVFVEVIEKGDKLASSQTVKQMSSVLRQIWRHIPRSMQDVIFSSLSAQQRELLLSLLPS